MYVLAAIVAGVGIGYLRGGRLRNVADADLRRLPLLYAGGILQGISVFVGGTPGVVLVLTSYAFIVLFTAVNLHNAGMGVVFVGVLMNALVIGANGGMPVRADAIVAAGIAERHEVDDLEIRGKRHLERPDDRLVLLGDVIPVPLGPLAQVVSFGDLVMAVGMADVFVHLMRRRERVSRPSQEASASTDSD